jgi:hypothetical protein
MRRSLKKGACWAAASLLTGSLCGCAQTPITATPTYSPPAHSQNAAPLAPAIPCTLHVVKINDERMDPSTLGVVAGRTVHAPPDTQTWMRSGVSALAKDGVRVEFGEVAPAPGVIDAVVVLKTAWVSSAATSKMASVVLHIDYEHAGQALKSNDYRGNTTSVNWASTDSEIQSLLQDVFGKVLAQVGTDFRGVCVQAGS